MKIHYLLLAGILLLSGCSSVREKKAEAKPAALTWYSWNDAYKMAKDKNKLIFVDIFTDWCGWCKKMDRDVYTDPQVEKLLSENFINVRLNPERTDIQYAVDTLHLNGYQMYNLLTNGQRTGFPTTVVLDPSNNSIIHAEAGYMGAGDFTKTMQAVLGNLAKK